MTNTLLLARRNLTIYLRDKTGVFLSFLAALILLALYILFLQKMNIDGIQEALEKRELPYVQADVAYYVNVWVFAGIVMVTTVTTGLGALVGYVDDRMTGRFTEFIVMPIRRWQIIGGYYLSCFVASFAMSSIVLFVGWGVVRVFEGRAPGIAAVGEAWGWVFLCAAGFSALNCFLITLTASTGSFVTLSTITGTMIGFLAAAYIPELMIPTGVRNVINVLPFAQAAGLLRRALASDALVIVTGGDSGYTKTLRQSYGFDLYVGSHHIPDWLPPVVLVALIAVFGALAVAQLRRRIK
ncbi:MAG: ABC transporter permease [Propionibacteriaceae bacterium]|jgi:multidrug/hemolysin transport system permease protein|nr:ABC transporter permease [Propionibacteriaceae bacterium]